MKIHQKKIESQFYDAVDKGIKTFELRRNDCNYQEGDIVILQEHKLSGSGARLTGRKIIVRITYLLEGYIGLEKGFCIFGFKKTNGCYCGIDFGYAASESNDTGQGNETVKLFDTKSGKYIDTNDDLNDNVWLTADEFFELMKVGDEPSQEE